MLLHVAMRRASFRREGALMGPIRAVVVRCERKPLDFKYSDFDVNTMALLASLLMTLRSFVYRWLHQ